MATVQDIVPDLDMDFSELDDDTAAPASEGPLTGSRGTRGRSGAASSSEGLPKRAVRKPTQKRLDSLTASLSSQMFTAGAMAGFALPVTGMYICQESQAFSQAVVKLASTRPEWIAALERLSMIEPGIIIGRTALGIGGALAVDRERTKPDSHVMKVLGVYSAWLKLQEEYDGDSQGDGGGSYSPPPFTFVPVG